jgi:esterase/lipase
MQGRTIFQRCRRLPRSAALAAASCLLASACAGYSKSDLLPQGDHKIAPDRLAALSRGRPAIKVLQLASGNRTITAYDAPLAQPRGVLIAFGGNGNAADPVLQVLMPQMLPLNLELVVPSYSLDGEPPPSVAELRAAARAVYDAVAGSGTPAAQHIYVLGNSLGCWLALDLADTVKLDGVILAAPGTTVAETFNAQYDTLDTLVSPQSDGDVAQFDGEAEAKGVHAPTLVFTSTADEVVDPKLTQRVYDALPAAAHKHLAVLYGVPHGGYFTRDTVWGTIEDFFPQAFRGLN